MIRERMTPRERLWAALHAKETDRMPWAPLMDPYFSASLPAQGHSEDLLQAARFIGCDFLERHVSGPEEIVTGVNIRKEANSAGSRTWYETPVGTISMEHKYAGNTLYVTKPLVESVEDAKVFQYVEEHTEFRPRVREFREREEQLGDLGMATLTGYTSPLQDLLQYYGGMETTVYLMEDYPDEMNALVHAIHEKNKRQYRALMEYPCDVVIGYENTSTAVMSRDMLLDYTMPHINEYADLCHEGGKLYITHMCGHLTGFLREIGEGRQDGVDSLCPPETGDLCPWDARRAWGKEKVVIGGIDPPKLSMVTERGAAGLAAEVIKNLENKVGFLLSTGDAVAYGTPIGNLRAIAGLITALGEDSLGQVLDAEKLLDFLPKL